MIFNSRETVESDNFALVSLVLKESIKYLLLLLILQIHLIAPPQYVVTTQTLDRVEGLARLNQAIEKIRETIENSSGSFNVIMAVSWFGVQPLPNEVLCCVLSHLTKLACGWSYLYQIIEPEDSKVVLCSLRLSMQQ